MKGRFLKAGLQGLWQLFKGFRLKIHPEHASSYLEKRILV